MISIITLVLSLLQTVVDQATKSKIPDKVIAGVQDAINALLKVQGTPVTYQQLEGLRLNPAWPSPTVPPPASHQ